MRHYVIDNINNKEIALRIHSTADVYDTVLPANSIKITQDATGYVDDLVASSRLDFSLFGSQIDNLRDLYTTDIKGIKVELFRDGFRFFHGFLDSEIWEEDYNTANNYKVDFKAGNIKLLKRIDFKLTGRKSVNEILDYIATQLEMNASLSSNLMSGNIDLSQFVIDTSIFYKDGEYTDCYSVLEELHKTFLLKSFVWGDTLIISDIDMYPTEIKDLYELSMGDSTLSAAEVYNKVLYKFDTGSKKDVFELELDKFEFPYPADSEVIIKEKQGTEGSDAGFIQLQTVKKEFSNITLYNGVTMCRNTPRFSSTSDMYIKSDTITREDLNVKIFETEKLPISSLYGDDWYLRLEIEALLSIRTNPFRGVHKTEDCRPSTTWFENHEKDFNNHTNYSYIFADVFLYDESGNITHYLKNDIANDRQATPASWWTWSDSIPKGQFKYCFYSNMKNESGFGSGWQTNSPTVAPKGTGYDFSQLTKTLKGKGTLANTPPVSGEISIVVYKGIKCQDGSGSGTLNQVYSDFKHLWYKGLSISICDINGHDNYSESEYQYDAELDNNAGDKLSIDTVIGSIVDNDYSCRGGVTDADGRFLQSFEYDSKIESDLQILQLNRINNIYSVPRFRFDFKSKLINPTDAVITIGELGKSFHVVGYDYNAHYDTFKFNLNENLNLTDKRINYENQL